MERFTLKVEKISEIKNLVEGEPNAFLILVGAMKYNDKKGRHESGSFSDADENSRLSTGVSLATGGKDRVLAAEVMSSAFPDAVIVPMSKTRDINKPTYAEIARLELEHKGVPEDKIILEEVSVSTITEFKEAAKLWEQYGWENMVFISSNWHLPRCEALFNHIQNFSSDTEEEELLSRFVSAIRIGDLQVQFLGSTDVLSAKSDHYVNLFAAVEEDVGIVNRKKAEESALNQIASNNYAGQDIPKKIWPEKL
jgi:DUF218 domain